MVAKLNIVLDIAFSARNSHKWFTKANLLTVYFMAHLTHSKRQSLPGGFFLHFSKGRSILKHCQAARTPLLHPAPMHRSCNFLWSIMSHSDIKPDADNYQ